MVLCSNASRNAQLAASQKKHTQLVVKMANITRLVLVLVLCSSCGWLFVHFWRWTERDVLFAGKRSQETRRET